jgi:inhibitor of KinA sporulation pathway (predicted exonuclease)
MLRFINREAVVARGEKRVYAVVLDHEFTAWEGSMESRWTRPGELSEVVQIGAVKLDAVSLKEVACFDMLVRPRVNPVLSDYLVTLTGITNQAMESRGVDFAVAYRAFLDFVGEARIFAHGRDDLILAANLKLYGWGRTLGIPDYSNAIPWFTAQGIDLKGKRACDVAELAGAVFEGHKHDALADARGVAAGFIALIGRGAPNPFLPDGVAP